jgi:D-alanyl-D-alanine-carboxypeptidase/D-alanyl-D-alanine-endopeptidase
VRWLLILLSLSSFAQLREAALTMNREAAAPGFAIVLVHNGKVQVETFGSAKPDSLIRIGSLSKVLATTLLSKLVAEGKLRLTDQLQTFAPAGIKVPQPMTLLQLATHTSGIPRSLDSGEPWQTLAKTPMLWPAGESAQYSSAAYIFLGQAISKAAVQPYSDLLRDKVTRPLGLIDTTATPNPQQCARLMTGSQACHTEPALASTASMYSTPADIARWLQHLLKDHTTEGHMYVQRSTLKKAEGLDNGGHADAVGLGWLLVNSPTPILQKTGGWDNFMSYIAFTPNGRTGVFAVFAKEDVDGLRRLATQVRALIADLNTKPL